MSWLNRLLNLIGYELVRVPIDRTEDLHDTVSLENDEGWEDLDHYAYEIRKKVYQ